jgi:diguanylate cyclase (GGDEF)-like protein
VSVAAIAVGGLLWTAVLSPRLQYLHAAQGDQVTMLVSLLVLGGILGALMRLWFLDRRLRSLRLLVLALLTALVGNVVMAWITGTMISGRSSDLEIFFMVSYICVGLAVLDPSAGELMHSGPAPVDSLTNGRLAFLGLALLAGPVAGGMQTMIAGLGAGGPLMVVGSVLVTSLVMIRVGRLARQRQDAEQLLRHQATHDLLTGLPNRAELLTRLAGALERERHGPPSVVLLFCDLNGFKQVNDRLGHEAGDQVLTTVAERIRAGLRAGDTLARYGGDEFLLLCSEAAQEAAVARLTGHVRQALATPLRLAGEEVMIGASIGAVISTGEYGADELISEADQAMYRAKQRHRAAVAAGHR